MKPFLTLVIISAGVLFAFFAQAQDLSNNPKLRERITQVKLTEIQKHLALSDEKMKALSPIYKRYDAELTAIHFARPNLPAGKTPNDLSAEEADKMIQAQLDNAIKLSTLRKNYYQEFKTVLTPQQIMTLFRSEAQMRRRVMMEVRKRQANRLR
ncbi:hypothetical protein TH63_10080 [Rufibacter radiotolerans]|uniref:Periplasmic heavy metal sensor n=1 Tax=Rufibacter radiotolerans TaxID=1379910 RepID=A0A0H4VQ96_9BACT|nr:hypothetical protein [Rufibacter radiotolerans]AKQ45914.1 hypothetical protein TH63_10080 [Rufibacter radiotolerans]